MYFAGQGVPQNYEKAVEWYTQAAEQGDAVAQNNLGLMHIRGLGVLRDYNKAFGWFEKAAWQGSGEAQQHLALMYHKGLGTGQDRTAAYIWCKLAGEQDPKYLVNFNEIAAMLTEDEIPRAEGIYKQRKEEIRLRREQAKQ